MRSSRGTRTRRAIDRTVGAGVAGVAVVGMVLSGCTSEPGPEPSAPETTSAPTVEPTATPTPTETASPETVKPERPEAMDEVSVEGAEAVARYFLELYPYVYATGDLSDWDAMSDPECQFCESVRQNAGELHDGGGYGIGPTVDVESADASPPRDGVDYFAVWVVALEGPSRQHGGDDEVLASSDGGPVAFDLAVRNDGEAWIVGEVSVEDATA